jgi:hypothetical protein
MVQVSERGDRQLTCRSELTKKKRQRDRVGTARERNQETAAPRPQGVPFDGPADGGQEHL